MGHRNAWPKRARQRSASSRTRYRPSALIQRRYTQLGWWKALCQSVCAAVMVGGRALGANMDSTVLPCGVQVPRP